MAILKRKALSVNMPTMARLNASVYINDVKEGILHSYVRHYRQWEAAVPQLRSVKSQLPSGIQQLIDDISSSRQQTLNRAKAEFELMQALELAKNGFHLQLPSNASDVNNFNEHRRESTRPTTDEGYDTR